MDTCFSCYRHHFEAGTITCSNSLEDVGAYYKLYYETVAAYEKVGMNGSLCTCVRGAIASLRPPATSTLRNVGFVGRVDIGQDLRPGMMLTVKYEDIVNDFTPTCARIFEHCGLEFVEEVRGSVFLFGAAIHGLLISMLVHAWPLAGWRSGLARLNPLGGHAMLVFVVLLVLRAILVPGQDVLDHKARRRYEQCCPSTAPPVHFRGWAVAEVRRRARAGRLWCANWTHGSGRPPHRARAVLPVKCLPPPPPPLLLLLGVVASGE
jgi:hypothetical protein